MNLIETTYNTSVIVPYKQAQVNWDEPIEIKVEGSLDKSLNCDWKDAEFCAVLGRDKVVVALNRHSPRYEQWICVDKATGCRTMYDCDSGGHMSIRVRNKVKVQDESEPHPKHSIVVYYQKQDDMIKVVKWEGLKSSQEIDSQFGKHVHEEYKKADIRAYHVNHLYTNSPTLVLSTDKSCWYIEHGNIFSNESFFDHMEKLQKAAKNLSNIRKKYQHIVI